MDKIKFLKFTRYGEWWEYKMVPLLAVAYLTTLNLAEPLEAALPRIALLFGALIVGAVYVSVINDLTDIKEDAVAGKRNSMANLRPSLRVAIVTLCVLLAALFIFLIYPDFQAMSYQALSYLVFTLYSVRPIRLKKRGFWGVLCDASGAHLFPSLLITTNLIFYFGGNTNLILTSSIGIWALMYGLRGILWHQFVDRENDLKSGTNTFAANIKPSKFQKPEKIIFLIEIIALGTMLSQVLSFYVLFGLISYAFLVLTRRYVLGYKVFLILVSPNKGYQLLLNDYYFVFLPLSLLLVNASASNFGWFILIAHFVFFPNKIIVVTKDLLIILKKIFRK